MKNSIYTFIVVLGILTSCASQKNLQESAPFEIGSGYCQESYGG